MIFVHEMDDFKLEGEVTRPIVRVDTRTTDDPKKVKAGKGKDDWWYGGGTNHRVENGQIKRDFIENVNTIEVESLEKLIEIIGENGYEAQIYVGRYQYPEISFKMYY